jgi:preprotein translocase subunit YajC
MEVFIPLVAVVVAFYFILLRPQIEQQKRRRSDISSLKVGDEVLTSGGLYATVREIRTSDAGPMLLLLEVAPGVVVRATPNAIESVSQRAADSSEARPDVASRPSDAS